MPRKSAAAIEMEPFAQPRAQRSSPIKPPADASATVRELSAEILASQPPDHWRAGDEFLVEQHAQSILAAREAHRHLEIEGYVFPNGRANPWIIIWEKANRATVATAAKLRLSPQQRRDGKATEREPRREVNSLGLPISRHGQPWRR